MRGGQQSLPAEILTPASVGTMHVKVGSPASGVRVTGFEYQGLSLENRVTLDKLLNLSLL